jgi:hypothetical protein
MEHNFQRVHLYKEQELANRKDWDMRSKKADPYSRSEQLRQNLRNNNSG